MTNEVPKIALELPAGDTRTANVYWSEMRGDTLHLCISVDASAQPAAPQGVAYAELPEPTPDELRAIARKARDSSGSASDDCGSAAYVLYGWRAAIRASNGQAPAGAWIERWYGSGGKDGYEGWSIVNKDGRDLVAYFGRNVEPGAVTEIVMAHNAAIAVPTAQAAPVGANVRRSDLVPGVMHCAKCKFQLNRVTLCVSDGNAYAGDNKTEPCPNGCGPLWPVTWEQEARNCWKTLEEMHERLQAAPAAGAVAEPWWKSEDIEVTLYPPTPTSGFQIGMPKGVKVMHKPTGLFATSEDERSQHRNRDVALGKLQELLAAAPTPAAQADSVLEDAARLEALHAAVTAIYFDDSSDFKSVLGAVVRHLDPKLAGDLLAWPKRAYDISQARLDAARKQGGT